MNTHNQKITSARHESTNKQILIILTQNFWGAEKNKSFEPFPMKNHKGIFSLYSPNQIKVV